MYVYGCSASLYVWTPCVCLGPREARRGGQMSWGCWGLDHVLWFVTTALSLARCCHLILQLSSDLVTPLREPLSSQLASLYARRLLNCLVLFSLLAGHAVSVSVLDLVSLTLPAPGVCTMPRPTSQLDQVSRWD